MKLTGIACLPKRKVALLEFQGAREMRRPILEVGERVDGLEVAAIDEAYGEVDVRQDGKSLKLKLDVVAGDAVPGRSLNFQKADLLCVLDIYQALCGRTVLGSPALPATALTVKSGGAISVADSARLIEEALARSACVVQPLGEKFVFVVPVPEAVVLAAIPNPPPPFTNAPAPQRFDPEVIPTGVIKFQKADAVQVLDVYSDLTGRELLCWANLSKTSLIAGTVSVKSQTVLSRQEAGWMLETLLRLANVAVIPEGNRFAYVVAPERTNGLPRYNAAATAAKARPDFKPASLSLAGVPPQGLLEQYARASGREASPVTADLPAASISFRSKRELAPGEMIFVLEALAALHGLEFRFPDESHVSLGRAGEGR